MKDFSSSVRKSLSLVLVLSFILSTTSPVLGQEETSLPESPFQSVSDDSILDSGPEDLNIQSPAEQIEASPSEAIGQENLFSLPEESPEILNQNLIEPEIGEEVLSEEPSDKDLPDDEPPLGPLDSEGQDPNIANTGQFSQEGRFVLPETDLSTGALTYRYEIAVPSGRNGMEPNLALVYNNQNASNIDNIFGYGWSVTVPHIERINKKGVVEMYSPTLALASVSFGSSLSGELVRVSSGSYAPKNDNSDFIRYTFASGSWSMTDKSGITYLFGQTASAQQDNLSLGKKYKWMLQRATDPNGNFISYSYFKDAGQIYPASISYTGFGSDPGIYEIAFRYQSRSDNDIYYTPGFSVKNNFRMSRIEIKVNGD